MPRSNQEQRQLHLSNALMKNPKVYLVVSIDGKCVGQILVELFYDVSPRAAEAFLEMCEGHRSEKTPAVTYLKVQIETFRLILLCIPEP